MYFMHYFKVPYTVRCTSSTTAMPEQEPTH